MKKQLFTGILGFLTIGTAVSAISTKVNALTAQFNASEFSSNVSIASNDTPEPPQVAQSSSVEVADASWACNTYPDGSYECCIVDSYGNWYCESVR